MPRCLFTDEELLELAEFDRTIDEQCKNGFQLTAAEIRLSEELEKDAIYSDTAALTDEKRQYIENHYQEIQRCKNYREANRDAINQKQTERRQANREEYNRKMKEYYRQHREYLCAAKRERRAKQKGMMQSATTNSV